MDPISETPSQALQEALAAELRAAQGIADVNVRTWAQRASITHDSIYRILRGRRPVSVVELVLLCQAINDDPLDLISRAARRAGHPLRSSRTIEVVRADRARLALEAAGLDDDPNLAYDKARRALAETGQLLSRQEWQAFLEGTGSATMTAHLGAFLEVPGEYLAGADDSATAKVETQLRFARTMRDVGVTRLAARSLDELGSDEIKAVEEAIREFIDEEEGHHQ